MLHNMVTLETPRGSLPAWVIRPEFDGTLMG